MILLSWNSLSSSDKIAILSLTVAIAALVVSIVAARIAYLQTQAAHPNLLCYFYTDEPNNVKHLAGHDTLIQTSFVVYIKNASGQAQVKHIDVSVHVSKPVRNWRLWESKWLPDPFHHESVQLLRANEKKEIRTGRIEWFLQEKVPIFFKKIELDRFGRTQKYFWLLNKTPLEMRVTVIYTSAIEGAKSRKLQMKFQLKPERHKKEGILYDWKLEPEIKAEPMITA